MGGSVGLEATASRGVCLHVIFSSSRPASKWEWVAKSSLAGDWLGGGGGDPPPPPSYLGQEVSSDRVRLCDGVLAVGM